MDGHFPRDCPSLDFHKLEDDGSIVPIHIFTKEVRGNVILNLIFAAIVTIWAGWLIIRRYKPQTVLFMAGGLLLAGSMIMGWGSIMPAGKSTGMWSFDLFELIRSLFANRLAGLGLNIMAVGGFARYMDKIGASNALVNLTITPLMKLKSPYIVMSACWVLGMFLGLAINSASGLAMLLMVTMFPILVALGVSRISATAAIATTLCLDWSPSDTGTILAAEISGFDPVIYWHTFQIPIACVVIPVVAVAHYFTQKIMDKRDGHVVKAMSSSDVEVHAETEDEKKALEAHPPVAFAILPVIPLALILIFSPLCIPTVKMNIIMAMFIGTAIGMVAQLLRTRDSKRVCEELQIFFEGMGRQLANVITIIIAGEFFAKGLTVTGSIDAMIQGAQHTGFGAYGLTLVMIGIIAACSIIMGSGNAPFFAFANLVPDIAAKTGVQAAFMILPMHLIASSARAISPITGVIIVASGMAGISPFDLVKRTAIPMAISCVLIVAANFVFFG